MKGNLHQIGVIGAGSWGTSLAKLLSNKGYKVHIWSHETDVVNDINNNHYNSLYLNNIHLPNSLIATDDFSLLSNSDLFVLAIPTQFIRTTLEKHRIDFNDKIVANVAKGIEAETLLTVSKLLADTSNVTPDKYVVLTGPSHAEEVSQNMPTTIVAASDNYDSSHIVQQTFTTETFRVYTSDDVIGCEIGGSLKNVIAIASGIIDGLKLGDNTKAALITRGLAEISRLGIMLGANPQTFSGLSGLGDLYVTCSSRHSRNRYVGEQIGLGRTLADINSGMRMIAEGVKTTKSAYYLSIKHDVELPIVEQIYKILFEGVAPLNAIHDLMTRKTKREWWW